MSEDKLNHKLIYGYNTFYLSVVEDYTFGNENTIIVKESATGSGAVVINNGRNQEEIPINGTLFGIDLTNERSNITETGTLKQLNRNIQILSSIKDKGAVVDFVGPFHKEGSNQYFIKSLNFSTLNDDTSIGFSMILTENRTANVNIEQKNITISEGYVKAFIELNKEISGVTSDTTIAVVDSEWTQYAKDKQDVFKEAWWKLKWAQATTDIYSIRDNFMGSLFGQQYVIDHYYTYQPETKSQAWTNGVIEDFVTENTYGAVPTSTKEI